MERQRNAQQALPQGMAPEEAIALADMMQLELGVKSTDVMDQLVNNDFEGEFFNIGDTVQVVAIDPNSIKVVEGDKDDIRPTLDALAFSARTMVIDKSRKYAFQVADLERLEDKWNHESAAHALAARKMREAACLEVLELITQSDAVATVGSVVDLTGESTDEAKGNKLFRLVNAMKDYLRKTGAIQGEEYKYGANKTVPLRGTASCFIAPGLHTSLLNAQYVRHDDVTEDVIRDGKYEKFAGLLLNTAPELDSSYEVHVTALDNIEVSSGVKVGAIIVGTKNTVTKAGKVLPPEQLRDHVKFATNYYGREIYGQMIAAPEACVVAFVKYTDEFAIGVTDNAKANALFEQFTKEKPTRANEDGFLPNTGYANLNAAGTETTDVANATGIDIVYNEPADTDTDTDTDTDDDNT